MSGSLEGQGHVHKANTPKGGVRLVQQIDPAKFSLCSLCSRQAQKQGRLPMGKQSGFERPEADFYPPPRWGAGVVPLTRVRQPPHRGLARKPQPAWSPQADLSGPIDDRARPKQQRRHVLAIPYRARSKCCHGLRFPHHARSQRCRGLAVLHRVRL